MMERVVVLLRLAATNGACSGNRGFSFAIRVMVFLCGCLVLGFLYLGPSRGL